MGDEGKSVMEVMELFLADISEIQHGQRICYSGGKGGWLGIVGELLGERVSGRP